MMDRVDYERVYGYIPTLTFTLEKHLENYAECELNARRLLESFHVVREKMEVNLRPIIALFPHYSEHSHEHSEHIIEAIEKLLGKSRIEKLSPSDTWMLLVSAYMHDLGMLVQGKELEEDWKTKEFQDHIKECMDSADDELKMAASQVNSIDWTKGRINWPVHVYRDVILLASEFYRRKHSSRARILPQRTELKQALNCVMSGDGKIPRRIQETVGKICFCHGIAFNEILTFLEPVDSLLGYEFHPRFVAALLCIGDLCDLDNGRFNNMAIEVFGGLTKNNLVHYYKHESVTSFVIQKDMISVNFDIQNSRIKERLRYDPIFTQSKDVEEEIQNFCDLILLETQNWINWMIDIVENIKLHWNDFYISEIEAMTPTLKYKILVDGKETVSSKKNMRFSFSNEKAYELIEGYNLYNNDFVFVRELLQNSIDALKKQFWRDIVSGRWNHLLKHLEIDGKIDYSKIQPYDFSEKEVYDYYQVKIVVKHKEGEQFANFVIEDNGTGISKEDVEDRIINTGAHDDKEIDEWADMPEWLVPTSAFGIGLHSVFAVTDSLFVQTRTEVDKNVYNINMHSGKKDGYVFMSVAENQNERFCNCNRGTRMKFNVDVSKCMSNDVNDYDLEEEIKPWKKQSENVFYQEFQNKLKKMLSYSVFGVSYRFDDDKEYIYKRLYSDEYMGLLFDDKIRNSVLDTEYKDDSFDFALNKTAKNIVLWDRKKAILVKYCLDDANIAHGCFSYCKGILVENEEIVSCGYGSVPEIFDCWGGKSNDILNITRDRFTLQKIAENKKELSKARICRAKIYYFVLNALLLSDEIKKWHGDIDDLIKTWMREKKSKLSKKRLNKDVNEILKKNSNLILFENDLKNLILRHGFCVALRTCEQQIKDILYERTEIEKIRYILNAQVLNKDNILNKAIKEQTNFYELLDASFEIFEDENEKKYLYFLYENIVKSEYAYVFVNDYKKDMGYNTVIEFGEIYITKFTNKIIWPFPDQYKTGGKGKWNSLEIYLSIPLMRIVQLLICTRIDISTVENELKNELSYIPGYNNGYCFFEISNIGDIIMPSRLRIFQEKYNGLLLSFLPFIAELTCKSVYVNEGKLIIEFNNEYEKKSVIDFKSTSFAKFLCCLQEKSQYVPVPVGYEDIAVKRENVFGINGKLYDFGFWFYHNYITFLWDNFINIKKIYSIRIASGEKIDDIVNEIMLESRKDDDNSIANILRFICRNRVYNRDLSFEKAREKIYRTYGRFVKKVLECIIEQS